MMISAHVLVKNEARFLWYSVMSVINYVDRVRLWDTGSTDDTRKIIRELQNSKEGQNKIFFKQEILHYFNEERARQIMLAEDFQVARQNMLNVTTADWFMVVDGDEIWWNNSIKQVTDFMRRNGERYESIVVPTVNVVGDMFHYQEKQAGKYHLLGKVGHYNLRAINRDIPGLKSLGRHGLWGWADENNTMIQDRDQAKIKFLDAPYLHTTHLRRSGIKIKDKEVVKRIRKFKYEIGIDFPRDYYYPEVFFRPRPNVVPSPWKTMGPGYTFRAFFETPLRKINRRIMPTKVGY